MILLCPKCGERIPRPKRKRIRQALPGVSIRAAKKARRETARERRRRVYAEVDARCQGQCEAFTDSQANRCTAAATEHDHFWGRGKAPETCETVWGLCRKHHLAKTRNDPGRLPWIYSFQIHCWSHNYTEALLTIGKAIELERAQHPKRTA